jgi:hypothetical protein
MLSVAKKMLFVPLAVLCAGQPVHRGTGRSFTHPRTGG